MNNAAAGAAYTMSDSGWVNGEVLMKYLNEHFLKFVQRGSGDNIEPILLIYDGHSSHVSLDIVKWARRHHVVLFVLPPHSSHALQPLDIACFGPFKATFHSECHLYMAKERGRIITKYEIAELSGKAYLKSMIPITIQAGFRKAGILPFDAAKVPVEMILPSQSFPKKICNTEAPRMSMKELLDNKMIETAPKTTQDITKPNEFQIKETMQKPKLGGKPITEDEVFNQMIDYQHEKKRN